jgi:hypothetical protein
MKTSISLQKIENGWIYIDIKNSKTVSLIASNVYDTPRFLIRSVNNLLKKSIKEEILWEAEIDCSYLILTRKSDFVEIKVEYDNKEDLLVLDKNQNKKNEVIFLSENSLIEFSDKIYDLFSNLINMYGIEGYKERWDLPFPELEFKELAHLLIQN